jgi:hypothetical protein
VPHPEWLYLAVARMQIRKLPRPRACAPGQGLARVTGGHPRAAHNWYPDVAPSPVQFRRPEAGRVLSHGEPPSRPAARDGGRSNHAAGQSNHAASGHYWRLGPLQCWGRLRGAPRPAQGTNSQSDTVKRHMGGAIQRVVIDYTMLYYTIPLLHYTIPYHDTTASPIPSPPHTRNHSTMGTQLIQ